MVPLTLVIYSVSARITPADHLIYRLFKILTFYVIQFHMKIAWLIMRWRMIVGGTKKLIHWKFNSPTYHWCILRCLVYSTPMYVCVLWLVNRFESVVLGYPDIIGVVTWFLLILLYVSILTFPDPLGYDIYSSVDWFISVVRCFFNFPMWWPWVGLIWPAFGGDPLKEVMEAGTFAHS